MINRGYLSIPYPPLSDFLRTYRLIATSAKLAHRPMSITSSYQKGQLDEPARNQSVKWLSPVRFYASA